MPARQARPAGARAPWSPARRKMPRPGWRAAPGGKCRQYPGSRVIMLTILSNRCSRTRITRRANSSKLALPSKSPCTTPKLRRCRSSSDAHNDAPAARRCRASSASPAAELNSSRIDSATTCWSTMGAAQRFADHLIDDPQALQALGRNAHGFCGIRGFIGGFPQNRGATFRRNHRIGRVLQHVQTDRTRQSPRHRRNHPHRSRWR